MISHTASVVWTDPQTCSRLIPRRRCETEAERSLDKNLCIDSEEFQAWPNIQIAASPHQADRWKPLDREQSGHQLLVLGATGDQQAAKRWTILTIIDGDLHRMRHTHKAGLTCPRGHSTDHRARSTLARNRSMYLARVWHSRQQRSQLPDKIERPRLFALSKAVKVMERDRNCGRYHKVGGVTDGGSVGLHCWRNGYTDTAELPDADRIDLTSKKENPKTDSIYNTMDVVPDMRKLLSGAEYRPVLTTDEGHLLAQ
ncbi:hypothetical protein RRG08_033041 [Elysia crispata]|uniref:Uncharacterized protein n=1 Tax=Elysia crispata TaxID=231223 RepID=A0AAE1DU40_9GAST|nr:hypothetical protein RRG08_033041 [Elysia crispata]